MNAITTGLAKAKYDSTNHQVNIIFDGMATKENFQETLEIVLEIGLINRTNHWTINLEKLNGLKPGYVVNVLINWMRDAFDKILIYGVKNKSELSIISNSNLRKYSIAVKKAKDKHLIPDWIKLRVFENECKLLNPKNPRVDSVFELLEK